MNNFVKSLWEFFMVFVRGTFFIALSFLMYKTFFYELEMKIIRKKLDQIEGVKVIDIWGNDDVTLEEVTARISIRGKGEVVLYGLSKDINKYPQRVPLLEIGNYSSNWRNAKGEPVAYLDVGTENEAGRKLGVAFYSVQDIVDNYDNILRLAKEYR